MSRKQSNLLADFSINRPVTVTMTLLAILVIGMISFKMIPIEMMPTGFSPPFLGAWIPYPNANPEEIEQQIARPVEEQVRTIPGVSEVSSFSSSNGCWVWVEFHNTVDMDVAYDQLRDRIERARATMPDDIDRVFIRKFGPDNTSVMDVAIAMHRQVEDPYYLVEHFIKTPLERINGVASVDIFGADEKIIEIEIDQDKLKSFNINLFQSIGKLRNDNFTMSSGWVKEGGRKFTIRSIGKFKSLDEVRNIPLGNGTLRLKDVARISYKVPERGWIQRFNGVSAVKLEIMKESMANTVEISHQVQKVLKQFEADPMFSGFEFHVLNSQGEQIEAAIDNLIQSAVWGAIFAVIILFFFLRELRMTLIVTFSIPVSITISLTLMYFMGWTLNIITMMGLMISVGMVIDNSIVVLENIFRHQANGMETRKAARKGAAEVGLAIMLATFTSVVVFLPLFIIKDDVGFFKFYLRRIGTPVIFALLASLMVALVLIPLATSLFPHKKGVKSARIVRKAGRLYEKLLARVMRFRLESMLVFIALLIAMVFIRGHIKQSDNQGGSEDRIRFIFELPKNLTMDESSLYLATVEDSLMKYKDRYGISNIDLRFRKERGRVNLYFKTVKNMQWYQLIWKKLKRLSGVDKTREYTRDEVMTNMKKVIPEKPGVRVRTRWQGGSGDNNSVSVVLYGDDTGKLKTLAADVEHLLQTIPSVISTETSLEEGNDELHLTIDREAARRNGLNPNQVAFSIMYGVRGIELPKFQATNKEIKMRIQYKEEDRQNLGQLKNMTFRNKAGRNVPLAALADISHKKGFGEIRRSNGKTNIEITATTSQSDLQKLSRQIDLAMKSFQLPFGYSWSKGKRFMRWRRSEQNFNDAIWVAVFFVFVLMGILFESFILPLSVMISIPLSFLGAFLALYLSGSTMDIMASIGFIILIGIVVNNAIVLIDLINKYREAGQGRLDAIMEAGKHRFRPILMTAFTTIAGILPLAIGQSNTIGISYGPLGMVIIGGMLVSTMLTLIAVPLIYSLIDDMRLWFLGIVASVRGEKAIEDGE